MQRLFVETNYQGKLELAKSLIQKLPLKIVLSMPVQFLGFQEEIKKQWISAGKEVSLFKSLHGSVPGQILGCDTFIFPGDYDAFLYIGDGKFHPTALLYSNKKPVYCYNPFTEKLDLLSENHLETLEKQKKGLLAKFFNSERIGILVSTKFGQNQSRTAEELRIKLEKAGKEVFVFLADEINFQSLENFNFVEVWINTACPRIVEDFKCLNRQDLKEFI